MSQNVFGFATIFRLLVEGFHPRHFCRFFGHFYAVPNEKRTSIEFDCSSEKA